MKELLISKYIDNQLTLNEKITFVNEVKYDDTFFRETTEMLKSEQLLNFDIEYNKPLQAMNKKVLSFPSLPKNKLFYQTLVSFAMLLIIISVGLGIFKKYIPTTNTSLVSKDVLYRFVYYNPNVKKVAILGSFTKWKKLYMKRVDDTGYWQIYIKLPKDGVYKYNFVVGKGIIIHDPSNPAKIYNGFGGFDSVLKI